MDSCRGIAQAPVLTRTAHRGSPIRWELTNSGWHGALKRAGIQDFRFHDLRHTWASWHRQAGTSCDEFKNLGDCHPHNRLRRVAQSQEGRHALQGHLQQ
jgi:hypothetical protein